MVHCLIRHAASDGTVSNDSNHLGETKREQSRHCLSSQKHWFRPKFQEFLSSANKAKRSKSPAHNISSSGLVHVSAQGQGDALAAAQEWCHRIMAPGDGGGLAPGVFHL